MSITGDCGLDLEATYGRIADVAEQLARTEAESARLFDRLALSGGEHGERRHALAREARQQMERLQEWAAALRAHGPS